MSLLQTRYQLSRSQKQKNLPNARMRRRDRMKVGAPRDPVTLNQRPKMRRQMKPLFTIAKDKEESRAYSLI